MSKIEGLEMLKILDFPTVDSIDPNLLDENSQILKQGLSVRTSPKRDEANNVNLPSIHNCTNLKQLRGFIDEYKSDYNIIVHKTVSPDQIGSISRYEAGEDKLIIELFEDFEKRKNGIIKNRVTLPIMGERFMINQLQMKEKNEQEFGVFGRVIKDVKYMPFRKFDAEFVVEDGKVLFTDLTIQSGEDSEYAKELKRKLQQKEAKTEVLTK